MKKINIAIDGFSSCGKSTIAKDLAKKTGYTYIDSGAMYRATALYAYNNKLMDDKTVNEDNLQKHLDKIKIDFETDTNGMQQTVLNGKNVENQIRTLRIADAASRISTIGFIRKALVQKQQSMGTKKGVVMDGRDIGTVVFPEAELKLFITASPEVRAKRRFDELASKGAHPDFHSVLTNVKERDKRDTTRKESPLKKAEDAIELDNSSLSVEEQLEWALIQFNKKINDLH